MRLRRLLPDPAELSTLDAVSSLGLADLAPPDRPYVVMNMVSTLDGRIAIDGRSGPIGGDADRELFHALRTQPDAVMVGAGTVRTERYGRIVKRLELREHRAAQGLAPDPLAVIVSGRLHLPTDLPLLQDPDSTVVVLTASEDELPPTPANVHHLRGPAGADLELRPLIERLRSEFGIRSILCEGGPTLNDALVRDGLVDELFLSLAPKLAGGPPLTLLGPEPLPDLIGADLMWLLEAGGHLFGRYQLQESLQSLE